MGKIRDLDGFGTPWVKPLMLDDETWEQVWITLKKHRKEKGRKAFRRDLGWALTSWDQADAEYEATKPSLMRKNLRNGINSAHRLLNNVASLDEKSRERLKTIKDGSKLQLLSMRIIVALSQALLETEKFGKTRLGIKNDARSKFSYSLYIVIERHFAANSTEAERGQLFREIFLDLIGAVQKIQADRGVKVQMFGDAKVASAELRRARRQFEESL